jgi:hypothetical protein
MRYPALQAGAVDGKRLLASPPCNQLCKIQSKRNAVAASATHALSQNRAIARSLGMRASSGLGLLLLLSRP